MALLALKSGQISVRSLDLAAFSARYCTESHLTIDNIAPQYDRWLSNKLPRRKVEERHCESLSRTHHPCVPVLNLCTLYRHLTAEGVR